MVAEGRPQGAHARAVAMAGYGGGERGAGDEATDLRLLDEALERVARERGREVDQRPFRRREREAVVQPNIAMREAAGVMDVDALPRAGAARGRGDVDRRRFRYERVVRRGRVVAQHGVWADGEERRHGAGVRRLDRPDDVDGPMNAPKPAGRERRADRAPADAGRGELGRRHAPVLRPREREQFAALTDRHSA